MQYTLGADEQAPGAPFMRFIDPNDFDRAQRAIEQIITTQNPGWFNIHRMRMLGFDGSGVRTFLTNYILMARTRKAAPSDTDLAIWKGNYLGEYPGSVGEDVEDYFDALMQARAAGTVSDTIFRPWSYSPTSTIEDIKAGIAETVKGAAELAAPAVSSGVNKVLIAAVAFGAIYLLGRKYITRKIASL